MLCVFSLLVSFCACDPDAMTLRRERLWCQCGCKEWLAVDGFAHTWKTDSTIALGRLRHAHTVILFEGWGSQWLTRGHFSLATDSGNSVQGCSKPYVSEASRNESSKRISPPTQRNTHRGCHHEASALGVRTLFGMW